ncbi:hypothetical protein [Streptomyces parvus]|uniref:hypothetical protein n=1 Tax=Streptomyces parvus TaxID=66428 RepID=UPI0033EF3208
MSALPYISALHAALRAVAADTTPTTLDHLDKALADLPLAEASDRTEQVLYEVLEKVGDARDSDLFPAVAEMEEQVNAMLSLPIAPVHTHPAMQAVVQALGPCYTAGQRWGADSANYRAWDRAMDAGCRTIRSVAGYLYADADFTPDKVAQQAAEFSTAVRRAVAYHARHMAGTVVRMAAYDYGMFVIGARLPVREADEWVRRIGSDSYRFEVTPPDMFSAAPTGRLVVTSLTTGQVVHDLVLSPAPERSHAVAQALFCI